MNTFHWIEVHVVYAIHARQIAEHGGRDGVRDVSLVKSALARPRNIHVYEKPDVADLAAAYAYGLIKNHGFIDGNKRTAWVVSRLFLADHGYLFRFNSLEAFKVIENVASGTYSENQLSEWYRANIVQS